MVDFTVEFADLNIGISSAYNYTYNLCKDYVTNGKPDFNVFVTEEQIETEKRVSGINSSNGYAESICIYREIAEAIPHYNRLVFHGACIEYEGDGFIFTALSGTGKSTHISLWQKYLGKDKVQVVNGDKPIIHIEDNQSTIYSTPYAGKEGWQNHSSAPLKAICFLRRGTVNSIRKATASEVLTDVFKQVYRPYNTEAAIQTMELLNKMLKLPIYILECDMSEEAVKVSFEMLTGLNFEDKKIKD